MKNDMAFSKKIRQQVYDKCNGHCAYCGREIAYSDMQVDHIHPQYKGGKDDFENLLPSCRMCNFRKGSNSLLSMPTMMATSGNTVIITNVHG